MFVPLTAGKQKFEALGATFDGSNDYATHTGALTGITDGKAGTLSVWLNTGALSSGTTYDVVYISTTRMLMRRDSSNNLIVQGYTAGNVTTLLLTSSSNLGASSGWNHWLASWDLAAGAGYLYKDDASHLAGGPTLNNNNIDYTFNNSVVGAQNTSFKWLGDMAELYFDDSFIDISVEANRRKFIDAAGKPVNLGDDGSNPTGSQPLIYMSVRPGDAADDFVTNRGSGGTYTLTGSLALSSTNPSD